MILISIIIILSYLIPLFFLNYRDKKKIILIWFIISIYQVVSFINGFFFRTPGADVDALFFHNNAIALMEAESFRLGLWADFYTNLLAVFYFFTGSHSILVGQSLSVLFVSFSIILFFKLFAMMGLSERPTGAILSLFLLPSMILNCPITLRESYEIFFSLLSFYCFLRYFYIKKKVWLLFAVISSCLMALFHPLLTVWGLFLTVVSLLQLAEVNLKLIVKYVIKKKRPMFILICLCLFLIPLIPGQKGQDFQGENLVSSLFKGNLIQFAEYHRHHQIRSAELSGAQTTYGIELELDSISSLFFSTGKIIICYFTAPFPWKVERLIDAYAVVENLWRIILIIFSIKLVSRQNKKQYLLIFMFFSYMFLEIIWAMGTVNYGTGIRHHLIGYWILVLLGYPLFEKSLLKKINKLGF